MIRRSDFEAKLDEFFAMHRNAYSWLERIKAEDPKAARVTIEWYREELARFSFDDWKAACRSVAKRATAPTVANTFGACVHVCEQMVNNRPSRPQSVLGIPTHRCRHCWDGDRNTGWVYIVARPGSETHRRLVSRYGEDRANLISFAATCVCSPADDKAGRFDPEIDRTVREIERERVEKRSWYRPGMSWKEMTAAREAERRGTRITSNRKPDGTRKDRAPEYER